MPGYLLSGARELAPAVKQTILGVKWTKASASSALTRTDDAVGLAFTPRKITSSGVSGGSSGFDAQPIYKDIRRCNVVNGVVTAYEGEPGFSMTPGMGDVMVEIPRFYYKVTNSETELSIQLSNEPFEGAQISPLHRPVPGNAQGEERAYVSAYFLDETGRASGAPAAKSTEIDLPAAWPNGARGGGWVPSGLLTWATILLLYLVEVADFNSQTAVCSVGLHTGTDINGKSGALGYHSGGSEVDGWCVYRGLENLWGKTPAALWGTLAFETTNLLYKESPWNDNAAETSAKVPLGVAQEGEGGGSESGGGTGGTPEISSAPADATGAPAAAQPAPALPRVTAGELDPPPPLEGPDEEEERGGAGTGAGSGDGGTGTGSGDNTGTGGNDGQPAWVDTGSGYLTKLVPDKAIPGILIPNATSAAAGAIPDQYVTSGLGDSLYLTLYWGAVPAAPAPPSASASSAQATAQQAPAHPAPAGAPTSASATPAGAQAVAHPAPGIPQVAAGELDPPPPFEDPDEPGPGEAQTPLGAGGIFSLVSALNLECFYRLTYLPAMAARQSFTATFTERDGTAITTEEIPVIYPIAEAPAEPPTWEQGFFTGWDPDPRLALICDTVFTPQFVLGQEKKLPVLGRYDSLDALQAAVTAPAQGDMYEVGIAPPYQVYIYVTSQGWVDTGLTQS